MRPLSLVIAALIALAPVQAANAGGGGGSSSGPSNRVQASFTLDSAEEAEEHDDYGGTGGDNPRAIDLLLLAVPAFEDDRLDTYIFISIRMIAADGQDVWRLREQTHFMRDAIIRAGHRLSVADFEARRGIDEDAALALVTEALAGVIGEEAIEAVAITAVETRGGGRR